MKILHLSSEKFPKLTTLRTKEAKSCQLLKGLIHQKHLPEAEAVGKIHELVPVGGLRINSRRWTQCISKP